MYLSENYPHLVEILPIGETAEGRPLKVVKVSSGQPKEKMKKPAIWIDGGTGFFLLTNHKIGILKLDNNILLKFLNDYY